MTHLVRLATALSFCVFAGCMTEVEGEPGPAGPSGAPGEPGPVTGLGLVWKDASGTTLPNAFVLYQNAKFAMLVRDDNGVFFDISPMSGLASYLNVGNGGFYETSNCSGPVHYVADVAPNIAFKFEGRIVALPPDVTVARVARSYYSSSSCTSGEYANAYVSAPTLTGLPTLTPPTLPPGPYHVDQR